MRQIPVDRTWWYTDLWTSCNTVIPTGWAARRLHGDEHDTFCGEKEMFVFNVFNFSGMKNCLFPIALHLTVRKKGINSDLVFIFFIGLSSH